MLHPRHSKQPVKAIHVHPILPLHRFRHLCVIQLRPPRRDELIRKPDIMHDLPAMSGACKREEVRLDRLPHTSSAYAMPTSLNRETYVRPPRIEGITQPHYILRQTTRTPGRVAIPLHEPSLQHPKIEKHSLQDKVPLPVERIHVRRARDVPPTRVHRLATWVVPGEDKSSVR